MPPSSQLTPARARPVALSVASPHSVTMDNGRPVSRESRRSGRSRPVAVPADVVLNFSGYEATRPSQQDSPPSARPSGRSKGSRTRPRPHDHFVTANCRFAVNPDLAPALSNNLVDADAPLEWGVVDVVFVEREATQEAAHTCPICLQNLSCPKITPCGHTFDHVCLLQHVAFSDTESSSGADVKCPLCSNRFGVDSIKNVVFREVCPVQVGTMCDMALVSTLGKRTIAVPFSPAAVHDVPAQVDSFDRMFSRFLYASRPFLLDMLSEMSSDLRNTLSQEPSLKPFVDQASRDIKSTRQSIRRRSSRESRPASMLPVSSSVAPDIPLVKDSQCSPQSLEFEPGHSDQLSRASPEGRSLSKLRLFYQAQDGQNVYLHPVNHRCLLFEHGGDLTGAKTHLAGQVVEIERHTMDEILRKRYRFLRHLPKGCEFVLVELDLSGVLSKETMAHFKNELSAREAARIRKKKKNEKESRRVSQMQTESLQDYFRSGSRREQNGFRNAPVDRNDETSFPALGGAESVVESGEAPPPDITAEAIPTAVTRAGAAGDVASSPGSAWGGAEISSYSAITSNMGLFPTLGAATGSVGASPPSPLRGAWATTPHVASSEVPTGASHGRETRRHRKSNGRQTFTLLSNAGSPYRR